MRVVAVSWLMLCLVATVCGTAAAHPRLKNGCTGGHAHWTWGEQEGEELDSDATWVRVCVLHMKQSGTCRGWLQAVVSIVWADLTV